MVPAHALDPWHGQRTRCDQTRAWGVLQAHYDRAGRSLDVRTAFADDPGR